MEIIRDSSEDHPSLKIGSHMFLDVSRTPALTPEVLT